MDFRINALCEKYNKLHVVKVVVAIVIWLGVVGVNVMMYYYGSELWVCVTGSVVIGVLLVVAVLRVSRNNSLFVYALAILHITLISLTIHS